ncbi:hypothetical protein N0V93_004703 [Gnomoniopsis smithogilvyi]|uniref:Oxidoreductase AflY n=1 Tax=Gnomoniopsis smithogilvyi TaxID=1191159 RepID=A0A9W8YRY6_9PEZI|nr:hypothetical protein N0V93_004703 [Gnomoniopsis smithogilvyi]
MSFAIPPIAPSSTPSPTESQDALDKIIHKNHVEHALLWDMGNFINIAPENKALGIHIIHSPHLLASLQLLGAPPARLAEVYASESKILPPPPSPKATITTANWRDHLGDRAFTQAYLAFFTHELTTTHHGNWRELLAIYLLADPAPLIYSVTGDLCHPLIHLGYAYELGNADLATDALVYCAVHYDPATEAYLRARSDSNNPANSPLEVLARVRADSSLAGFPPKGPGREHFAPLFEKHESIVLEHWATWPPPGEHEISAEQLSEALDACVGLLVGTTREGESYDFILLHALTGCYALRVVLPEVPVKYHTALFHHWWLFTLMVYITQGRPEIDDSLFTGYPLERKDWSTPVKLAIESPAGFDAHYVKAIRAIKSASDYSGQVRRSSRHSEEWYLKAATRFAETFRSYRGFGPVDEDMIQQLMALTGQGSSERH